MADIVRAQGRQFLERYQSSCQLSAAEGISGHRALPHRCARRTQGQVCSSAASTKRPSPITPVDRDAVPKCQAQARRAMARGAAAGTAQHQLLPRRVHRASRTEPAGTHLAQARFSTCCSRPVPRPCSKWPPIPNGSAQRSDSSPSCIPGVPTCCAITMSTASSPAADCHPTISAGSTPATRCSCCPFRCCAPSSATSSSPDCGSLYRKDLLDCRGPAADFQDPATGSKN